MTENSVVAVAEKPTRRPGLNGHKIWKAFKNFAIVFSFVTNLVLVIIVLLLIVPPPGIVIKAKDQIVEPLLGNLDGAFAALGDTDINTTVQINHQLPVQFDLPLKQNSVVVLTEAVPLQATTTFMLPGGGGAINGTVSLNLPVGMKLPVSLDLNVPVNATIPVVMQVPVAIPLDEAGMGPAITQLRGVFMPLIDLLAATPDSLNPVEWLKFMKQLKGATEPVAPIAPTDPLTPTTLTP